MCKTEQKGNSMSKKFYISDIHFGHKNILEFDKLPFADVDEMDRIMIDYWNMRVQKDDEVYIIGDFLYRSSKDPTWYLRQLSGKKFLVLGNHDTGIMDNPKALAYFEDVDKIMNITDGENRLVLCHFPIVEWDSYYRRSYHIYGHIHSRLNEACLIMRNRKRALNAAACINNYMPVTLNELIENNKRFEEQFPLKWSDLPPE